MNLEEASENFDKQSRVLVNNIQATKYKFDKDIKELTAKDIEQFSSKEIMLVKNIYNGTYYIFNKVFYDTDEIFGNIKEQLIQQFGLNKIKKEII